MAETHAGIQAVAASERVARTLWTLAWPAVALNTLQTVNSLLDSFFVGQLPRAALTAVSAATPVMFFFFSFAMALGTATTAIVSRAYGAGQEEEFRRANRQALALSLFGGAFFSLFAGLLAPAFAALMTPPHDAEARSMMTQYVLIYALGIPANFLIQALAGSLRGIGDTKSPMVISGAQILLHIVLNYLFIFEGHRVGGLWIPGLGWGVAGAAAALTASAWVAALAYLAWSGRTPLGSAWGLRWPAWSWTVRIGRIGLPAAGSAMVRVFGYGSFTWLLAQLPNGSDAQAALRPSFAVESIAFMPAFGLSVAAAALVGQSLGMKRPDRAERIGWLAAHHAAIVSTLAAVVLFVLSEPISAAIIPDKPQVAAIVASYIRFICATEIGFAYGMVLVGAMQGAGDTVSPLVMSFVTMIVLRLPLAYVLAFPVAVNVYGIPLPVGMGVDGAWLSMSITQAIQGAIAIWMFKRGRWKLKKV